MLQSKHVSWLTRYKNKAHIYAACKKLTSNLETQTESQGTEKGIPCKQKSKESCNVNTRIKQILKYRQTVLREKEGHYTVIKGSIQEDKTTVNILAPNIGAAQYIKLVLKVRAIK